jgi:hypothetical protein
VLKILNNSPSEEPEQGLSDGALIGIVSGVGFFVAVIIAAVIFVVRHRPDETKQESSNCEMTESTQPGMDSADPASDVFDDINAAEHQRSLKNFEDPNSLSSHSGSADIEDGGQAIWL